MISPRSTGTPVDPQDAVADRLDHDFVVAHDDVGVVIVDPQVLQEDVLSVPRPS